MGGGGGVRVFVAAAGGNGAKTILEGAPEAGGWTREREQARRRAKEQREEGRRQERRREFLLAARRVPGPAGERIYAQGRLKRAFDNDYAIRHAAAQLEPDNILLAVASDRSRNRADVAGKHLDNAIMDLTSLTEEAKREWDEQEASGWEEFVAMPAHALREYHDDAVVKWLNFAMKRDSIERPLVEAYADAEDRVADWKGAWTNQARKERAEALERLEAAVRETVQMEGQWEAKKWEGYEMQDAK